MAVENAVSVSMLFPFVSEVSEYNRIDISARERKEEIEVQLLVECNCFCLPSGSPLDVRIDFSLTANLSDLLY